MISDVFKVFFLVIALVGVLSSPRTQNHRREDNPLERRGLLGGTLSSLRDPGSNSLFSSRGLLEPNPRSSFNPTSLPRGSTPRNTPGDAPWSQADAAYRSLISCPGGLGGPRGVVLLVPPTAGNGREVWSKSRFAEDLPRNGFSICWVDNPTRSVGDAQLTAEFIAYAIKSLAFQSKAPISIITYSQGGINTQWALTFWPSARQLVRNMVTVASPFRGTIAANLLCPFAELIGGCLPAVYQMAANAKFIQALNAPVHGSGGRALVPTTSIYSLRDEVVPQVGRFPTSALPGASNIALQEICGSENIADHFLIIGDAATYGIALNALLSGGVANPATLDRSICNMAGNLDYQARGLANYLKYSLGTVIGNPGERVGSLLKTLTILRVTTEPPLQMYVCQMGHATGCTGNGFSGPQGSAPILSNLPQTIQNIAPVLGHLFDGGRGRVGGLL